MVYFLTKFENRSIKIALVNSILITKSINLELFTLILYSFGVRFDLGRFSVLRPFTEKSMIEYKNVNKSSNIIFIIHAPHFLNK